MRTKKQTGGAKVRLTVDLSERDDARLRALAQQVSAPSKADVIRDALRLYEYFVQKVSEGHHVLLEKDDARERIVLFTRT
jgi:Arc/MetJ-type ribon-helix-helix transcriptional regulator